VRATHTAKTALCASIAGAIALLAVPCVARALEPVTVTFLGPSGVTLSGLMYRPSGAGPHPAVLALHGCGGNMRADGKTPVARVPDWTTRFVAAGFAVLWPDSFGSRGLGPQCRVSVRDITPAKRAQDADASMAWLTSQPDIDATRVALIGWSNGGSTVLRAVSQAAPKAVPDYALAVAFYPGCRPLVEREHRDGLRWGARRPLTILMGAADDWTAPDPCRTLGTRPGVRYVEYPDAYHDFDAPDLPVRVRTGLGITASNSGEAHVGTHPAARAAAIDEVMQLLRTLRQ
jgi:dienelactone hydrolase